MKELPHIIATLGPATEKKETIKALFDAGCNWFRLNTNHGDPEWHEQMVEHVRTLAKESGEQINFFYDLCGPKIRIGEVSGNLHTSTHDMYVFTKEETTTSQMNNKITIQEPAVLDALEVHDLVTIGDTCITFKITKRIDENSVQAEVIRSGTLASRRGIAVPGKYISVPLLTERDKEFVRRARQNLIWYFALSFVQSAEDIENFRTFAKSCGIPDPYIIAKVETTIGVANIAEIAENADIVMVARGDLMIDTGIDKFGPVIDELVAGIQKSGAKFIMATEMMSSMVSEESPTRAEVMNVYQAKKDGAWAIMLSNETAVGKYPIACVRAVRDILEG